MDDLDLADGARLPTAEAFPSPRRNRKRRRSQELVAAVQRLDTATDPQTRRELAAFIDSLYEAQDLSAPVALFSTCYLGSPYLDHVMALEGEILQHYVHTEKIPEAYVGARELARSRAYAFIEIYEDGSVIPIRESGDAIT